MKRSFDLLVAIPALLLLSPLLVVVCLLIFLQDYRSPFYYGRRVGRGGRIFSMVKMRSMVINAESIGARSTAGDDRRITPIGLFVRRFKLDEFPQLWNIVRGDMSLVGPRPNVPDEVALYSNAERRLLDMRPGLTDFASIVFSDEGDILRGSADPDRDYNLLIRPWKSRLGLHYVTHRSLWLDVELIALTALAILAKPRALEGVQQLLRATNADPELCRVARRDEPLQAAPPPGVTEADWEDHLAAPGSSRL